MTPKPAYCPCTCWPHNSIWYMASSVWFIWSSRLLPAVHQVYLKSSFLTALVPSCMSINSPQSPQSQRPAKVCCWTPYAASWWSPLLSKSSDPSYAGNALEKKPYHFMAAFLRWYGALTAPRKHEKQRPKALNSSPNDPELPKALH